MTNLTFDGVALVTEPGTLGELDCGHGFTAFGHVAEGAEVECPEHCRTWETMGSFATRVLHTEIAMNLEIS